MLLYDQPRIGTGGSKINFLHPKSGRGVLIEIVQPGEGRDISLRPGLNGCSTRGTPLFFPTRGTLMPTSRLALASDQKREEQP